MREPLTTPMFFALFHPPCDRLVRAFLVCSVCLLVLTSLVAVPARAQETAPHNPPPAAIEGYNRGRALYQAGRYREAVVELERALALDPTSPNLVYNVARVHELLGELDEATQYYERYRSMLPAGETAERERVDSILLRLEGARTQVTPEPAGPPTDSLRNPEQGPRQIEQPSRGVADAVFWTAAGIGAAALLAGAGAGVLALKEEQRVDKFVVGSDGTAKRHDVLVERADRLALTSDVMLMVGTTFAVSSILLYTLRKEPSSSEREARAKHPRLGVSASAHAFALTFGGAL